MRQIVPVSQINRRPPEAGRIRIGVKTGKAMKAIDTFRFTSSHRPAIEALARDYGGQVSPWSDGTSALNQWEVITEANEIDVLIQPGGLSTYYEMWSGGGCARRCDGEMAEVPGKGPDADMQSTPCICERNQLMECRPYTRLNVVLPNIDFYGVWRLESKGWNVAQEMPGMFEMLVALGQSGQTYRAMLALQHRTRKSGGTTKRFIVPTLSIAATPDQMLSGGGTARPSLSAAPEHERRLELAEPAPAPDADDQVIDAEVIDAEVVDPQRDIELEDQVRTLAEMHNLSADLVVSLLWQQADADLDKIQVFINKIVDQSMIPYISKNNTVRLRTP